MKTGSRDYYAARARAERLAAENAASPEARIAHEEMASAYAQLAAERSMVDGGSGEERPAA